MPVFSSPAFTTVTKRRRPNNCLYIVSHLAKRTNVHFPPSKIDKFYTFRLNALAWRTLTDHVSKSDFCSAHPLPYQQSKPFRSSTSALYWNNLDVAIELYAKGGTRVNSAPGPSRELERARGLTGHRGLVGSFKPEGAWGWWVARE